MRNIHDSVNIEVLERLKGWGSGGKVSRVQVIGKINDKSAAPPASIPRLGIFRKV